MITSRYGNVARAAAGRGPIWPNVTIPDFQEQVSAAVAPAGDCLGNGERPWITNAHAQLRNLRPKDNF